jgi:hypothetical protein
MRVDTEISSYAQMGVAALLPGMQHMLTLMQVQLDEMRARLGLLQNGGGAARKKRVRRLHRKAPSPNRTRYGWPADPEDRRKEMARRREVARSNARKKSHPRDPGHPDHEAWVEKMRKANRRTWKNLSPADRKARIQAAVDGWKNKKPGPVPSDVPAVKMAAAS